MKTRSGYTYFDPQNQKWTARITFTDSRGKRRQLRRVADSEAGANKLLRKLLNDFETKGEKAIDAEKMTFSDLAAAYRAFKVKPAEYVGDRKTAGLRSFKSTGHRIDVLVTYFGKTRLRAITPGAVAQFKEDRLKVKTRSGKDRSITAVNRELETLRAILRYAKGEGWIDRSPFENVSTPVISKADETKRDRVLSRSEEEKLLLACADGTPREHLRPLIVAALDSGARRGELLALTWDDINLVSGVIRLRALTTKTLTERFVPISSRLADELRTLLQRFPDRDLVFGITLKFQHSWETACKKAGLSDLRFHDLRSTFCTRLIGAGMPIEQVAKLSGHSQLSTLYAHYLSTTAETIEKAADLLNQLNAGDLNKSEGEDTQHEFIN
jgi:integrase